MDVKVKQRLIGALVLGALAVIFVPMIVIGPEPEGAADAVDVPISVPAAPEGEFVTREIPLGPVASPTTETGITPAPVGDPNALATVDATAGVAPRVDVLNDGLAVPVDAATGQPVSASPAVATAPTPAPSTPAPTPAAPAATTAAPAPVAEAPTPSAPPAPVAAPLVPAAVAAGDYSVTAGSFGNRANADALVARLKSSGLPAYTEAVAVNGQPATRVKVGPFADRAGAEAARVRTAAISGSAAVATGDAPVAAATAPRTSAPATAALPARSGFAVQLGAFASQAEADALVARAQAAGFTAFEQRVPTDNGVLWRVRLGPAAERGAAEQMKTDAAGKLGVSGIVVPHP